MIRAMEVNDIIKPENLVYQKSRLMAEKQFNFCPGCGHGVVVRTIAEVIEEMGIEHDVIGISPVYGTSGSPVWFLKA